MITKESALKILDLSKSAEDSKIREKYKQLAIDCHPRYNPNLTNAYQDFHKISLAFKRLLIDRSDEATITMEQEMYEIFESVFGDGSSERPPDSTSVGSQENADGKSSSSRKRERRKERRKKLKNLKNSELEFKLHSPENITPDQSLSSGEVVRSDDSLEGEDEEDKPILNGTNNGVASKMDLNNNKNSYQGSLEERRKLSCQYAVEGNNFANKGCYKEAVKCFTKSIKLFDQEYRFYGNRSYCLERLHLFTEALDDADTATRLSPRWAKGHFRRGKALLGLKIYKEAEDAFKSVLDLDANCQEAIEELEEARLHQLMEMGFSRAASHKALEESQQNVQIALERLLQSVVNEVTTGNGMHVSNSSPKAGLSAPSKHNVTSSPGAEIYLSDEEDEILFKTVPGPSLTTSGTSIGKPPGLGAVHSRVYSGLKNGTISSAISPAPDPSTSTKEILHPLPTLIVQQPKQSLQLWYESSVDIKKLRSIWVGNVQKNVTDSKLKEIFSKAGKVTSVKLLSEKFCAFVNFESNAGAENAIKQFQGMELAGYNLLLRFPDHPVTEGQIIIGNKQVALSSQASAITAAKQDRKSGPVQTTKGEECYFWRTTGCQYGKSCKFKHIPESKAVDLRTGGKRK